MLTPEQKLEAERKLKGMNEELAKEEQLKSTISTSPPYPEKTAKSIKDAISSMKEDPKRQLELLRKVANQDVPAQLCSCPARSAFSRE